MTTIFTSDTHFSVNPRDAYRFHFLEEWLPRAVEEHGATRLVVGGDIAEAKDDHSAALVNRVVDGFARLAETVDVICYSGNHDRVREDMPYWRFMKHVPRVRWINEPTALKLRGLGRCLFLPHTANWERDWEGLDFGADWTFAHQTFAGAKSESGREMGGVPRDVFPRGARVVSGDVHVPQKVGCVTYSGAPYRIDFGDDFEPRVLLLDGDKMRSVPVEGPQKRMITVSGKKPLDALHMKHPLQGVLPDIGEGDVVKVRVDLPDSSDLTRAQVRAAAREWAAEAGVELYAVQVVAPKPAQTEKTATKRDRRTDTDLVRAYAKRLRKGNVTLAAGLKIAEEVA